MGFQDVSSMAVYLGQFSEAVARMMPDVTPEQAEQAFVRVLAAFKSAAIRNPKWLECEPVSVAKCAMWCAHLDLYPGGYLPDVYLIPRSEKRGENNWVKVLNAQPSWRGLKTLAERAGCTNVRVRAVYEGDAFEVSDGTQGAFLRHVPTFEHDDDFDKLRACYVLATLPTGQVTYHVTSKRAIERHRGASDAYAPKRPTRYNPNKEPSGPWVDHPVPMAMKTAIADAVSRGTLPINDGGKALGGETEIELIDIAPKAIEQKTAGDPALISMGIRDEDVEERQEETVVIDADQEPAAKDEAMKDAAPAGGGMDPRSIAWALVYEREEGFTPERLREIRLGINLDVRTGHQLPDRTRTTTLEKYAHELHKARVSDDAGGVE